MLTKDDVARVCHEANRAYCLALGDTSQVAWEDAPDWQRESARLGVDNALNGATPEQSHECWMMQKAATGWRYGAVKDAEAKTHPCFVPYAQLPADQLAKDALFVAVVNALRVVLC
jgi:hypothetical protein